VRMSSKEMASETVYIDKTGLEDIIGRNSKVNDVIQHI
jgi:hypothetical protein